jgi:sRNA-binding carbon storage regulator CsrA
MLVLSRKSNESVVVGSESILGRVLRVTVLEILDGCVTLAFDTDEDVPVMASDSQTEFPSGPKIERRPMRGRVVEGRRRWLARPRSAAIEMLAPFCNLWRKPAGLDDADEPASLKPGFGRTQYRKCMVH